MYLRRVKVDNVRLCDIHVGGYVNVLSRRLKIVDYARISTRQRLKPETERYSVPAPENTGPNLTCLHACTDVHGRFGIPCLKKV